MRRFAFLALLLLATPAAAQAPRADSATRPGRTLAIWTAVARDQPLKTRLGHTYDRDLYIVGLRTRRALRGGTRVALAYTADLLPAVVSTRMPSYTDTSAPCPPSEACTLPLIQAVSKHTVYGVGAVPIGLELRVRIARPLALLARGSAGLVYFARPVPDPEERRLNFLFDVGAAAEVRFARRLGLIAGWRLNHISNGGRGPVNPGMNSRMLELGVIVAR